MNKIILPGGIVALLLAACPKSPSTPVAAIGANPEGCSTVQLNLTLKLNSIKLVPPQAKCVIAGVAVNIKPTRQEMRSMPGRDT